MSEPEAKDVDEFLSIPSHMKNRGWQLGILFSVPSFVSAIIVLQFLPGLQAIVMLTIALFVPFAAAYTGYRIGSRDAAVGRRS